MAYKQFALDDQTTVTIYKRKASRSLRLSIAATGEIRVSIPVWAPYAAGVKFAQSRQAWIKAQQRPIAQLSEGQAIGKAHRLRFLPNTAATRVTSRLRAGEATVGYPADLTIADTDVQRAATQVSIRALRTQAEQLLPQRLASLAEKHGFAYASVSVKQLKSRWGSCDQEGHIVLNLFLMQLPWECIDYVLLHELMHTRVLRHGPGFWQPFEAILPDLARLRKTMRSYQPILHSPSPQIVA